MLSYVILIAAGVLFARFDPVLSIMRAQDFFPGIQSNLTKITWAHAVNNKSYLEETLKDNSIMMIEADIILGKVDGKGDDVPIMGHPPANTSDLSLDTFLSTIKEFNDNGHNNVTRKGVKLDFKSIDAFELAMNTVSKYKNVNYPVWLNADILPGPVNATATPVNPRRFLQNSKNFTNAVLSIGWTTNYEPGMTNGYTDQETKDMRNTIKDNAVTQEITFPVRAALAAQSLEQFSSLISDVKNSTLTIWSGVLDTDVDVDHLRNLIKTIGLDKVYIDVPENLKNKLHLETL